MKAWAAANKKIAMMIGLRAREFYEMTQAEFMDEVEGWRLRDRNEWMKIAHLEASILSALTGKRIKPEQCVPSLKSRAKTAKQIREDREALKRMVIHGRERSPDQNKRRQQGRAKQS